MTHEILRYQLKAAASCAIWKNEKIAQQKAVLERKEALLKAAMKGKIVNKIQLVKFDGFICIQADQRDQNMRMMILKGLNRTCLKGT